MSIVFSIIIFGILVFVHEFGHFVTAKVNDVRVDEFALGMGPKLFGLKKGDTEYTLRILPLGGYVRMAGMEPPLDDPRGFNTKTVLQRMAIIFAGPMMNFVTALILFILVFMIVGTPSNANIIGQVMPGKPAAQAGLMAGDRIVKIDSTAVSNWQEVVEAIHKSPGREVAITFQRDHLLKKIKVVPEKDQGSGMGLIGILQSSQRQGVLNSVVLGLENTYGFTKTLLVNLGQMITGAIAPEVAGPVGVVQIVGEVTRFGWASLLTLAGYLSINLGLINLFPIPALDGSRLAFLGFEALRGRPLDPAKENVIHLVGFALLMLLMVFITYQDILRLFKAGQ